MLIIDLLSIILGLPQLVSSCLPLHLSYVWMDYNILSSGISKMIWKLKIDNTLLWGWKWTHFLATYKPWDPHRWVSCGISSPNIGCSALRVVFHVILPRWLVATLHGWCIKVYRCPLTQPSNTFHPFFCNAPMIILLQSVNSIKTLNIEFSCLINGVFLRWFANGQSHKICRSRR